MSSPPDLVLVTADSVRADHCGFVEPGVGLTPRIDELAADGVGFTQAVAPAPRTPASAPSFATSEPLPDDRIDPNDWAARMARIRRHVEASRPLAARLRDAGYTTIAFTGNPYTGPHTGFDSGFDEFHEVGRHDGVDLDVFSGTRLAPVSKYLDQWWNKKGLFSRWEQFFDDAVERVRAADGPVFLWVFLLDSHNPYRAPRRDREESTLLGSYLNQIRANSLFKDDEAASESSYRADIPEDVVAGVRRAYRDSIRSVDRFVGQIREALADRDPVVAFHSDHGEAFREHGTFGHQRRLYEENVRVPLAVAGTGADETVTDQVPLRRLCEMLASHVVEGTPVTAQQWRAERTVLRTEDNSRYGVRSARWKYVEAPGGPELYDLRADPGETENLAGDEPDVRRDLGRTLESFRDSLPEPGGYDGEGEAVDSAVEDQLASLGYID